VSIFNFVLNILAYCKIQKIFNYIFTTILNFSWAPHELGLILVAGSSDGSISTLTYTGGSGSGGQQWETDKITSAHMIGCNAVSW
jgi:protein transport protein SEC13